MSKEEIATRRERAADKLYAAGALMWLIPGGPAGRDCRHQCPAGKGERP